jgi:Tol biopolymer transport system component
MPLEPGQRVGSYQIVGPLGAGGMGQVYRARDSKLNRDVALKVIPEAFAADPDRLGRFTREAQTLAALNHPNIATIFGVEEAQGTRALVMEMVPGDDLSTRLARGSLPVVEALPMARQIADALEAAHEQGIVHRDLKPANLKVRDDGTVKVLDFGLAKAMDPASASGADTMNSPTLSVHATQAGVILGTAAYMAPEQARGKVVDRRADIWAFGVVLSEMLTGTRLFEGESIVETLSHILSREPDLSRLPPDTPPPIRSLIERCLVKDPRHRLRDIGDARLVIDDAIAGRNSGAVLPAAAPAKVAVRTGWAVPLLAATVAGLAAGTIAWTIKPVPPPPVIRMSIPLPLGEEATTLPSVSSDGRVIAYASGHTPASSHLYLRTLGSFAPTRVDNSVGAQYPFFSPDGRSVAFFAGGKLRRASVDGGGALDIAAAPTPWGGTWDRQGRIVYTTSLGSGLWRVPENGGTPEHLTTPDGGDAGYAHVFPQQLPGTDDVLFSHWGRTFFAAVLSPERKTWRTGTTPSRLIIASSYSASGHLLSNDGAGNILATRWTPATTAQVRPETPVITGVHWTLSADRLWINVSDTGTAVYVPGDPSKRRLVWVDRQGRATELHGRAELVNQASVSHDGRRVVYGAMRSQWVVDVATGAQTRLVSDARTWIGGWMPGDDRIALSSNRDGDWDLYTIDSTGGDLVPLLRRPLAQHVQAIAPDGTVVFLERHPTNGSDLYLLTPGGQVTPLVTTRFNEDGAVVSPDGRYVAYVSDESGRRDVFAMPLTGGTRVAISIDGGSGPVWSRDGKELFYRSGDDLVSQRVDTAGGLTLGERKTLISLAGYDAGYFHDFDVSPDGQRFLLIRTDPEARPTRLDVIVNWFDELNARVK